jgi:hypothetical protein
MRRIGFLIGVADDTNSRAIYEAFRQGLQLLYEASWLQNVVGRTRKYEWLLSSIEFFGVGES